MQLHVWYEPRGTTGMDASVVAVRRHRLEDDRVAVAVCSPRCEKRGRTPGPGGSGPLLGGEAELADAVGAGGLAHIDERAERPVAVADPSRGVLQLRQNPSHANERTVVIPGLGTVQAGAHRTRPRFHMH